jgi:hypothetical protein
MGHSPFSQTGRQKKKRSEKKKKRLTSFEKRINLLRGEPNKANIFPGLGFKGEGRGHTNVRSSSNSAILLLTSCIERSVLPTTKSYALAKVRI